MVREQHHFIRHHLMFPVSGFHLIYLPYADDIRTLDPPQFPSASQIVVDKMKQIVSKLRFKYRCCHHSRARLVRTALERLTRFS